MPKSDGGGHMMRVNAVRRTSMENKALVERQQ
jgi:hypothetical protein